MPPSPSARLPRCPAECNITRPGGLTEVAPSLQVSDDTGPYSIFYVRGVGNFAANGLSDAALAFNFDGVTVSRSGTSGFFLRSGTRRGAERATGNPVRTQCDRRSDQRHQQEAGARRVRRRRVG